jgi:hypothetical protein
LNWATIRNNNYGREAAAFLKAKYTIGNNNYWATIGNNNYGREAAFFLMANYWVSFGQLGQQLRPRSGRLLELGNNCEQQPYNCFKQQNYFPISGGCSSLDVHHRIQGTSFVCALAFANLHIKGISIDWVFLSFQLILGTKK